MTAAPRRLLRKLLRRSLAVLLGFVLVLVLLELSVRVLPLGLPNGVTWAIGIHEGRNLVCAHDDLRYALRPDLEAMVVPEGDFGLYEVTTTPAGDSGIGFRGPHDEPPFGVVLGDSFAFGFGAGEDETIPVLLTERFGEPFANFGVFGHGPQQARIIARDFALPRGPRVAIWIFYGNDLGDAWRFEDWTVGRYAFQAGPPREFHNTYWATYKLYRYLRPFHSSSREHWGSDTVEYVFSYQMFGDLDLGQASIRSGLDTLLGELTEFEVLCRESSTEPLLVLAPFKEAVYLEELREVARRDPDWSVHDTVHGEITAHAEAIGLKTLDLTETFRAMRERQLYFVVDGHLSPEGNEVAAQAIGDALVELGLASGK